MRPSTRLQLLASILALSAALVISAFGYDASQREASITPNTVPHGIRNILYLAIKSDPDFIQGSGKLHEATLTVKVRISAHSQETNFYGDVPATVPDFDPTKGSRATEIWKDARCHHERGFPKMTVISVDGSLVGKQKKFPITARFRRLGLLLPEDEVMAASGLRIGYDDVGRFIATRTETKQSRIIMDLKMYILPCELSASTN